MNKRKTIGFLLLITILLILSGYYLTNPETFGLCSPNELGYCLTPYNRSVGQPLVIGMVLLLPVLMLLYLRQETFTTWKKFAIWALPLGAILIALTPVSDGGAGGIGLPSLDREIVTWLVSSMFLAISLTIILRKQFARQAP